MNFNKKLAIILVLLSMLLSSIAISLFFYKKSMEAYQVTKEPKYKTSKIKMI